MTLKSMLYNMIVHIQCHRSPLTFTAFAAKTFNFPVIEDQMYDLDRKVYNLKSDFQAKKQNREIILVSLRNL